MTLTEPPVSLEPESFAARLYESLEPLGQVDDEHAWALLKLCNSVGTMFQAVEDMVRDTPAGPGWSSLLDLDRCPPEALAWLGQFVGARVPPALVDPEDQRQWIASTDGFKRGTLEAMIGACRATLTGTKAILFRERSGGPTTSPEFAYYLTVYTYAGETPDPAATLAALQAQKPGGLVLVYGTPDGQTYGTLNAAFLAYTEVRAAYPDYASMLTDQPL